MKPELVLVACLLAMTACVPTTASRSHSQAEFEELTLDRIGRVDIGPGAIGEVNGRDYLFLAKSVEGSTGSGIKGMPGILVFDLKGPEKPTEIAYLEAPEQQMHVQALALSGTVLYASTYNSLWIIDVSTPSAPREISRLSGIKPDSTVVSGRYAYIPGLYCFTSDLELRRIVIADISDPAAPELLANFAELAGNLKVSGSLLLGLDDGLRIFDISSPGSLEELGYFPNTLGPVFRRSDGRSIPVPGEFFDMAVAGHYVYLASGIGGLRVLDIANPATPSEVSDLQLPPLEVVLRVFTSGKLAYLISGGDRGDMINVIDIADPLNPTKLSSLEFPPGYHFSLDSVEANGYLYCFAAQDNAARVPAIVIINLARISK